ncbi:MAG: YmdB family metallophosphoesterase, partial [Chloroflexota bacterium]
MRVLLIGDIVGRPGRVAVERLLPGVKQKYGLDLIIANAENASGGFGITPDTAQEILDMGVHVLTSGNHIWAQREIIPYIEGEVPLVRPLNYPPG